MLFNILIAVHVLVCLVLILVVLLQSSKGGGLAGAFGGGGGQTMFGGQETATFLGKATTYLAIAFMVLSLLLAFMSGRRNHTGSRSIVRQAAEQQQNVIPSGQSIDEILGGAADTSGAQPATETPPAETPPTP
ncbi:MAG TPA: preprotein translocase subunit SecG [Candidatus Krumholzibacteria bacterium]|nr:preprotein translocase subunit SecG [Candidatus Krumholzibacteria bacterium]